MDSFIAWVGGKRLLRKKIINRIPENIESFIEVFGGAAWVLFAKPLVTGVTEVYNDVNPNLQNLFLQVKYHPAEFDNELKFCMSSRKLFSDFIKQPGLTEIQRAVRFFFLISNSFGGKGQHFGRSFKGGGKSRLNARQRIQDASVRLDKVIIENLDFEKLISDYDHAGAFFYLDPPYVTGQDYRFTGVEFTEDDHIRLRDRLKKIKGKFLLSYDDSPAVRELYKDFKIESVSRLNGINGKNRKNKYFKEVLISNY